MADLNLIDFYKDTAQALIVLHNHFPRKKELYVEDFIGSDHVDEFGLHSKRHEACLGALLWLADEGYIRYHAVIRQEAIDQAILSAKSVVLLGTLVSSTLFNNTPQQLDELPTFEAQEKLNMVEQIRCALKSESSAQLTQVMKAFYDMGHNR